MRKFLGASFPGLPSQGATGNELNGWVRKEQERQAGNRQIRNLHYTRHDNFRWGRQWLSQRDNRMWREPQADKNSLRPVLNMIGPALDFRLGILMEQRPGFSFQPVNSGAAGKEVAEAQQALVEYEFYRQRAWQVFLDAQFWAQTHGVAFIEVFVDKSRGPEHEDIEIVPQDDPRYAILAELGYEQSQGGIIVPLDDSGNYSEPGVTSRAVHEGELYSRIVLANETLSDPEARSLNGPTDQARWFIKRKARDVANVRLETGKEDLKGDTVMDTDPNYETLDDMGSRWSRGLPPFPRAHFRRQREMVWENCVYFAKDSNALPEGAWFKIIGNEVTEDSETLPGGVIPFARVSDGSSDPSLYPRPVVSDWIGDQISINALLASGLQAARLGGGRLLARKNTVQDESYTKIIGSLLEYTGEKPEVIDALRASPDLMPLLMFMIRQLENKDGWNDLARGQVTGGGESSMQDVSGRALLGAKELFERTFGPMVRASAEGVTEWANVVVQLGKFIMQTDRLIPRVGRPDLAITLNAEKLGNETVTFCDAETMMPLPRSLREQMLLEKFKMGLIDAHTYQERSPYADTKNIEMGDSPQWERAKWINTILEERYQDLSAVVDPMQLYSPQTGLVVLWQDTPKVHKRALLELILNERKPWALRKLADDRWGVYDQLDRAQADPNSQWPIPWEVIGVPPDKIMMQQQPPQPVQQQPMGQAAGTAPQPMTNAAPAALPTSPTPDMSAAGLSAASQDAAQPLGSFGDIERAAQDTQS